MASSRVSGNWLALSTPTRFASGSGRMGASKLGATGGGSSGSAADGFPAAFPITCPGDDCGFGTGVACCCAGGVACGTGAWVALGTGAGVVGVCATVSEANAAAIATDKIDRRSDPKAKRPDLSACRLGLEPRNNTKQHETGIFFRVGLCDPVVSASVLNLAVAVIKFNF